MRDRLDTDPLGLLRIPAFRAFALSRFAGGAAQTMLQTVIAWQVFEITGSALQLGLIGLVRFVPALAASLVGGAVADAYNRRTIILTSGTVPLIAITAMLAAIAADSVSLGMIYLIVLVTGLAASFENPARQALIPQIVPRDLLSKAITFHSTIQSLAFILGSGIGGGLIALGGVGTAYAALGVLVVVSLLALIPIRVKDADQRRGVVSMTAIREGVSFVTNRPILLSAMALDMFALIFAGTRPLLPIFAVEVLHVGSWGFGILNGSIQAGALLMSLVLIVLPPVKRTGAALLLSVFVFGILTSLFGLSQWFYLSVLLHMALGMADQVSVVMRHTTIQLATPDELRGRVSAVSQVFVSASSQISAAAFLAAVTTAGTAIVTGGALCMGLVAFIAWRVPQLRNYRQDDPMPVTPSPAAAPSAKRR